MFLELALPIKCDRWRYPNVDRNAFMNYTYLRPGRLWRRYAYFGFHKVASFVLSYQISKLQIFTLLMIAVNFFVLFRSFSLMLDAESISVVKFCFKFYWNNVWLNNYWALPIKKEASGRKNPESSSPICHLQVALWIQQSSW